MAFFTSKTFFALMAGISLLRLLFFGWVSMGSRWGEFGPAYKLEQLSSLFSGAPVFQIIGILLLLILPFVLFLALSDRYRENFAKKTLIAGLAINSLLLLIYLVGQFLMWGTGFNLETIVWFIICLTFFVLPLIGFLLLGFWGIESIIFLFLTTVIQVGLLSSVILSWKIKRDLGRGMEIPIELQPIITNSSNVKGIGSPNMNTPTWTVRIPGQPENPVDTATLQNWAKSGFVKADTMITEVSTGYVYQARQIPGVFSNKSFVTALLLSFFFGVFGVDRFYLGHVGVGLGKLFTFGGLGIWALIDFILIATKNVKDSQGTPLA